MTAFDATVAAQRQIGRSVKGLVADGRWGKFTQAAYDSLSSVRKSEVDDVVSRMGYTIRDLARARHISKVATAAAGQDASGAWIPAYQADQIVQSAAEILGMTEHTSSLQGFLRLEAKQRVQGGQVQFDAASKHGQSRGLMQMQPGAWVEAGKMINLGPYGSMVMDPHRNVLAGVAYAKYNLAILHRLSKRLTKLPPITSETLYLMHNQGAGFFTNGIVTARDGQSAVVRALIDKWSGFYEKHRTSRKK